MNGIRVYYYILIFLRYTHGNTHIMLRRRGKQGYDKYMCGIFGYVGKKEEEVAARAYHGLRELEYRGYDSWGIVAQKAKEFHLVRAVGKISDKSAADFKDIRGTMALGHSRWATHGGVSEKNAHPQLSYDDSVAVIHNGIIENHRELKHFLVEKLGQSETSLFRSETDTEVIPHLIAYFVGEGKSFEMAFIEACRMLEGRYAIVAMKKGESYLMAMRRGSPLVLGKGVECYFVASDVPAFLDHTRTVAYPEDKVAVKLKADELLLRDITNAKKVDCVWKTITWDKVSATKEGYPHYMLKEIMEQGNSLDQAIRQDDAKLAEIAKMIKSAEHLFFVGCGTAAKMAKLGELYLAKLGGKLSGTFVGSEFSIYEQFLDKRGLLFAVSQSGETADVLEALAKAEEEGAKIVALLNVVDSSIDRMSDTSLYIHAGPEIAVASTKAATAQIAVLLLLAHAYAGKIGEGKHLMRGVVKDIRAWLNSDLFQETKKIAEKVFEKSKKHNDLYVIGRGLSAPIAHEAAIKIQEVSYIHAEGFSGGELKHGPIALVGVGTPVIAIVPNDETKRDMESNTTELRARGAYVIGIAPENSMLYDEWIKVPNLGLASPIASLIPIQLLAYHLALLRGNDPDKPRNLAKSVTVK